MRKFIASFIALALVLAFAPSIQARTLQEIEQRVAELEQEAEGASLQRRTEIMQELLQLQNEAMQAAIDQMGNMEGLSGISVQPAATPEEEAKRRRDIINAQFRNFKQTRPRKNTSQKIEMPEAFPLKGLIVVNGGEKSKPYRGWIWTDFSYTVVEEFVGNLIVKHEYDLKRAKFTGKKNYALDTISDGIRSNVAGRKCIRASAALPGRCTRWENISRSDIADENRYHNIHDWVLMGGSEGGRMKIKAESPTVVFRSQNRKATGGLGCFGAEFEMSKGEFENLLDRDEIRLTKHIGRSSQATPGCKPGSILTLYLYAKTPECYIQYTTDPTLIYGCDGGEGIVPPVGLKANLKKGTAQSYKWSISEGADKVKFLTGDNPTTRKADIKAISSSGQKGDVGIEVEIKRTDGTRCVATLRKTAKKPSALRRLGDSEASSFDITPFIDFTAECAKPSGCIKSPIPIPGNPDIGSGYARISVNQVLDQFYEPILRDPMLWKEKRWMMVDQGGTQTRIDIPTLDESPSGTQIPIVPGQSAPTLTMHSNHGMTEGGGLLLDTLAIMYPVGTSMHPQTNFKINQNIKIFDCAVGKCVQHFKKSDATHTCQAP